MGPMNTIQGFFKNTTKTAKRGNDNFILIEILVGTS